MDTMIKTLRDDHIKQERRRSKEGVGAVGSWQRERERERGPDIDRKKPTKHTKTPKLRTRSVKSRDRPNGRSSSCGVPCFARTRRLALSECCAACGRLKSSGSGIGVVVVARRRERGGGGGVGDRQDRRATERPCKTAKKLHGPDPSVSSWGPYIGESPCPLRALVYKRDFGGQREKHMLCTMLLLFTF